MVTNTKKKIRLGLIYESQENVASHNELKKLKIMYEDISEQIKIGKEEKQHTLILGDFNWKIGAAVKYNKRHVTKGGRRLLKPANKENMIILNTVKESAEE